MISLKNMLLLFHLVPQKVITAASEKPISLYVQIILYAVILIVGVGLILYFVDQVFKHWQFFRDVKKSMKNNYFLILTAFPIFYLIYYYAYYLPNKDGNSIWLKNETADMLWTASLTFLGTGVLTGSLKWLNNLAFFKRQFSDLIKSEEFSNVLSEKMKELALSDDYLLQRNDLEEIWIRVTICKYQQKFPELGQELISKIENDFFLEKSLSYYYKNFRLQVNFTLEGDIIKIVEISSFTIISHSTEKIELNFGTTSQFEDVGEIYTELVTDNCKCNGKKMDLREEIVEDEETGLKDKRFTADLSGKKKYVIERQIEMTQDIKDDRVFSFSSSRIIEDLSINLKYDENLKLFFSPVGKNIFNPDNHIRSEQSMSYINREVLLPGEKFKVFIFKKS